VRTYLTTPFADECGKCSSIEDCTSGCLAQKIIYHGKMCKVHDPMCLRITEQAASIAYITCSPYLTT
jgi:sulfatase maturation enzyme AslB (radical SAM superfamily)